MINENDHVSCTYEQTRSLNCYIEQNRLKCWMHSTKLAGLKFNTFWMQSWTLFAFVSSLNLLSVCHFSEEETESWHLSQLVPCSFPSEVLLIYGNNMWEYRVCLCRLFWFTLKAISPIHEAGAALDLYSFSLHAVSLPSYPRQDISILEIL